MTILDQAEQLRQQAISLLLQERGAIEQKLTQLGYDSDPAEIQNRKPKTCARCGETGHNSRRCPKGNPDGSAAPPATA